MVSEAWGARVNCLTGHPMCFVGAFFVVKRRALSNRYLAGAVTEASSQVTSNLSSSSEEEPRTPRG